MRLDDCILSGSLLVVIPIFVPDWRISSHAGSVASRHFASLTVRMCLLNLTGFKVIQITTILDAVHVESPVELACHGPKIDCVIFGDAGGIIVAESHMGLWQIILFVVLLYFFFVYPIVIVQIYGGDFPVDEFEGLHIIKNGLIFRIVFRTHKTQSKKCVNRLFILIFHDTIEFKRPEKHLVHEMLRWVIIQDQHIFFWAHCEGAIGVLPIHHLVGVPQLLLGNFLRRRILVLILIDISSVFWVQIGSAAFLAQLVRDDHSGQT